MSRPDDSASARAVEWPLRLIRSLAAALVCTVTAALGHLAGGGVMPTEMALIALLGSALVAWWLSARRITTSQLIGLLVLCQVCVHFGSTSMSMSGLMVTTHIVATIASAALLTRGEALVWHLAERLGLHAAPLLDGVHVVPSFRPAGTAPEVQVLTNVLLANSRAERGPPALSL